MARLNISKEQYEDLRRSGMSEQDIVQKYSAARPSPIVRGATAVANTVAKGATDFLANNFARMGTALSALRPDVTQEQALDRLQNIPEPNAKQAVGAGLQLGSIVSTPVTGAGVALGRTLGASALQGAAALGGQAAAEDRDALTIAKQAGIGGVASAGLNAAARGLQFAAKKGFNAVIPKGETEAFRLQNYKADHPFLTRVVHAVTGKSKPPTTAADTAFEKGLMGPESWVGIQAKRAQKVIWNTHVKPALQAQKAPVAMQDFFEEARTKIIADNADETIRNSRLNALDSIIDDYKGVPSKTLEQLQDLKSSWSEYVPDKAFRGENIASAVNDVRDTLAAQARKTILERINDPSIRQAYIDYGNLDALAALGRKAMTNAGLKGGAGNFTFSLLERTLIPIVTVAGQTVYKVGDGVQLIGKTGLNTVGQFILDLTSETSPQGQTAPTGQPMSPVTGEDTQLPQQISDPAQQLQTLAQPTTSMPRVNEDGSITVNGPFSGKEFNVDPNAVGGTIKGGAKFVAMARSFLKKQPKPELLQAISDYNNWYDWGVLPKGEKSGADFLTTFQRLLKQEAGIDMTGQTKDATARFTNEVEELIKRLDDRWQQ